MERQRYGIPAVGYVVLLLGLVAFTCCVAAEINKAQVKDLKIDGNLCSLPRTPAFGLGVAALVCLSVAQIVGTSAIGSQLRSRDRKPSTTVAISLLVLSWVCFGLAVILLGTGSSMNKGQAYREQGWLDSKCYVVKDGVYLGAGAVVAVTVILILGFTITTRKRVSRTQPEEKISKGDGTLKPGALI